MSNAFGATLDKLYAAVARPERWPDALSELADFVGGPGAGAMLIYNNLARNDGFLITGRLREDLSDLYVRRHVSNPYTLSAHLHGPGRPQLGSSLVASAIVRRTALHADILAPQRIQEQVIMSHAGLTRRNSVGGIGITLDQRGADGADHALRRMERIAPHLCRALDLSREVARRGDAAGATALLQALATASVLLDGRGAVLEANAAAEALLSSGGGLALSRDRRLHCALAAEDRRLRAALERAAAAATGEDGGAFPQAVRVRRPGSPGQTIWAFELTAAEARVAALIASGLSAPQAATALDVSPNTVRTHLARCFDKTGARSQVALARLVAGLGG